MNIPANTSVQTRALQAHDTIRRYSAFLPPAHQEACTKRQPTSKFVDLLGYQVHVMTHCASVDASVKDDATGDEGSSKAPHRVVIIHGSGGHSAALWPLAAQIPASLADIEALDLPLYGLTKVPDRSVVRYEDWVAVICAYLRSTDDGRPVTLWGLSIGGLLSLEAAYLSGQVAGVIATCLVDPGTLCGRQAISRWGSGVLLSPFLPLAAFPGLRSIPVPMPLLADMSKMSRDPGLTQLCSMDPLGGGTTVPLGFLASLLTYDHQVVQAARLAPAHRLPQAFRVLLVHPAADQWTPPSLSVATARRIGLPWQYVSLPECGHFPIEAPGLARMVQSIVDFLS